MNSNVDLEAEKAFRDIVFEILGKIASGKTITSILASDPRRYPNSETWWRWVAEHPPIKFLYDLSRKHQAETWANEIIDISDECEESMPAVAVAKLRVQTRHIAIKALLPEIYGNKVAIQHTIADNESIEDLARGLSERQKREQDKVISANYNISPEEKHNMVNQLAESINEQMLQKNKPMESTGTEELESLI